MRLLSLLLGVLLGLLVAGIALVILVMSLPAQRITPATATPGAGASSSARPTVGPSGSPAGSASASPIGSATASAAGVGLAIGDTAPPLAVPRLGGGEVDLTDLRGRPVWVNFMASWCPPCRDELPVMERARRELGDQLEIVAIDVREDEATAAAFAEDLVLRMPVGLDTDGRARDAWSAFAMPVHYWLDADGVIRHSAFGGIGPDIMLQGIRSVVPDADWEP